MTSTSPRTARAARLLAALLVPLVALPALTGLVVCVSDAGVTTSWGERPCPKTPSATVALSTPDGASAACVAVPDAPDAPLAEAPVLRAPTSLAVPLLAVASPRPAVVPVARPEGPRGPPVGALRALRTTVLRV